MQYDQPTAPIITQQLKQEKSLSGFVTNLFYNIDTASQACAESLIQ